MYRAVRVVRGSAHFTMECRPRVDYGHAKHELEVDEKLAVSARRDQRARPERPFPLERHGDDLRGEVTLHAGEVAAVAFTVCESNGPARARSTRNRSPTSCGAIRVLAALGARVDLSGQVAGYGPHYRDNYHGLTLRADGAPIAAATMGLPEQAKAASATGTTTNSSI